MLADDTSIDLAQRRAVSVRMIAAPAAVVWAAFTDFAAYPDWSPMIRAISGRLEPGAVLDARIGLPGEAAWRLRPRVIAVSQGHHLVWRGVVGHPWVLTGEHRFRLIDQGDRCRFEQEEQFSGFLAPLVAGRGFLAKVAQGFAAMNAALAARVER